jgi:lipoate-protein ligase A
MAEPVAARVRLLPGSTAPGAWQMAADEVMLEGAAAGTASVRFYRWSEPTVSLGYFQPESVRREDARLGALPFVRRATGGATLVHHHELTYALALPAGPPWQRRGESWIGHMHRIVAAALAGLGVAVRAVCAGEACKLGDVLCFLDQTPCDLLAQGRKVVGSAQRRRKGALLQHGGILLARSKHTPALPGLRELAGLPADDPAPLKAAIVAAFEQDTGWRCEPGDWTGPESTLREELMRTKYASHSWNAKR